MNQLMKLTASFDQDHSDNFIAYEAAIHLDEFLWPFWFRHDVCQPRVKQAKPDQKHSISAKQVSIENFQTFGWIHMNQIPLMRSKMYPHSNGFNGYILPIFINYTGSLSSPLSYCLIFISVVLAASCF